MENLKNLLEQIKTENFKVSKTQKGEKLQQTQSNTLKNKLLEALAKDIADEITPYVYRTEKGFMLEIENQSVADQVENDEGSGAITVLIDCVIKSLDTNAENEGECYKDKQAEKQAKKEAQLKAKKEKIKADALARKKKKEAEEEGE